MSSDGSAIPSKVRDDLLTEAARFAWDTFFDQADYDEAFELPTGDAVDRGWQPLDLTTAGVTGGVQVVALQDAFGPAAPPLSTAAHFYVGEVEGKRTLAIAFRSVDEPDDVGRAAEFAFIGAPITNPETGQPGFGWDLYQLAHQGAVRAALDYASDAGNQIDQVLIAGHSLGGIIGELTTSRVLLDEYPNLVAKTITMTFGQPGSQDDVSAAQVFNIFHTDDLVARLSDLSPLFQDGGAAREGVTLPVERPEWVLPNFTPEDLDSPEEVLAALLLTPENRLEHSSVAYIDTATLLAQAERVVPGIGENLQDSFRWLQLAAEKGRIGTENNDWLHGDGASDVLFGREGNDRICGGGGDDGIVGGEGNDRAFGGRGSDAFLIGTGHDRVDGGRGTDLAVLDGDRGDFKLQVHRGVVTIRGDERGDGVCTVLTRVEQFSFDDGDYRLHHGRLVLEPEELQVATAPADFML